jgi:6-pyruvoyltetrahydropterin/6-carboxytetrahydropterin synthase
MAPTDLTTETEHATATEETIIIGKDSPIRISSGHRIQHHDGKCSRPHGHNYKITVEISARIEEKGWVVDKGDITSIIDNWDHMFVVEEGDPLIGAFKKSGDEDALIILSHPPTAEVMAAGMKRQIANAVDKLILEDIDTTVSETDELCASY